MKSKSEPEDDVNKQDDPITGVIGDIGKYQILMCLLIAVFEVCIFNYVLHNRILSFNFFKYIYI